MINKKYVKNLIIRVLLSIILFLTLAIFVNFSDQNLLFFKRYAYNQTFNFSAFNRFWADNFGSALPDGPTLPVNQNILTFETAHAFYEGAKLEGVNVVLPFKSGIVVYVGEREHFGNTIIIQGMNGIDYWYGNVTNINVKLYDFISSDNIIANAIDNTLYVQFKKNGEVLDFEEFI